jgi:hypothetical protein
MDSCSHEVIPIDLPILHVELTFNVPRYIYISDMAPNFTGNALTDHLRTVELSENALKVAERFLSPKGVFLTKLLGGPEEPRKCFSKCNGCIMLKPVRFLQIIAMQV